MFHFFYKRPKACELSVTSSTLFEVLIGLFLRSGYLKKRPKLLHFGLLLVHWGSEVKTFSEATGIVFTGNRE
tara:strand:- start:70 stop:285 length:216 start_codon:yes stop_codon:yes gene_type:complete